MKINPTDKSRATPGIDGPTAPTPTKNKRNTPENHLTYLLPAEKRAKICQKYHTKAVHLDGRFRQFRIPGEDGGVGNDDAPDSDEEYLQKQAHSKHQRELLKRLAEETVKGQNKSSPGKKKDDDGGGGGQADEDLTGKQLLARSKRRLETEYVEEDDPINAGDEDDDDDAITRPWRLLHKPPPHPHQGQTEEENEQGTSDNDDNDNGTDHGAANANANANTANKVLLVFRDKNNHRLSVRVSSTEPLERAFNLFTEKAIEHGWVSANANHSCSHVGVVKFIFDDEEVDPSTTPADLDVEDNDIFDVKYI